LLRTRSRRATRVAPRAALLAALASLALARGAAAQEASVATSPAAGAPEGAKAKTRIFPLPLYATNPNEGSTYGVMPVLIHVLPSGTITSILAPSASWNASAGITGTYRQYYYPDTVRSYAFIAAISQHVNRRLSFEYKDRTRQPGHGAWRFMGLVRRNLFFRYYGLGPETVPADESSYTRTTGLVQGAWAYFLTRDLSVGPVAELRGDRPEAIGLSGLPLMQERYPNAPGIDGAELMREGVALRFDTREGGEYATSGLFSEVTAWLGQAFHGFDLYGQTTWDTRLLVRETRTAQLAARVYWTQLFGAGANLPFYFRPSLGGEILLRGYPEDRFIGNGAWEIEMEQRLRIFETDIFGAHAEWRVDPFVIAGQVYEGPPSAAEVRVSAGAGFRVLVRPDVLGRIDVAYAGEGLNAYVSLGYAF
jgi:hypothetical protein